MERNHHLSKIEEVFEYHELSKHQFHRSAPGPGTLDWANQPNPFRRYLGAKEVPLKLFAEDLSPNYEGVLSRVETIVQPLTFDTISQLFQDSLGLSAWKGFQDSSWALRVNPSSGNLHPTEGYVICGSIKDLSDGPNVAHYAPKDHLLEIRARFSNSLWNEITKDLPEKCFFVALTSIYWRESWKYGERAFRYCHHDVGHAIGAMTIAAAVLGWGTRLISHIGTKELESMLGLRNQSGPEREHPDCCLVIFPQNCELPNAYMEKPSLFELFDALEWQGKPNELSPEHVNWPQCEKMSQLTQRPFEKPKCEKLKIDERKFSVREVNPPIRQMIHQRRSAVAFDGVGAMSAKNFYSTLEKTLPARGRVPFEVLDWEPKVNFLIFVHRVEGLEPGLYFFCRNLSHLPFIKENSVPKYLWTQPEGCPEGLPLFSLMNGDVREASKTVSCTQDIASDGCFSLGMITQFEEPIRENGPWFYQCLFWESGLLGQVLYLDAEVVGIRATGIGCFFDDPVHELLGLKNRGFQSLYHFTVGHPVEDTRLTTLPPYSEEFRSRRGFGRG